MSCKRTASAFLLTVFSVILFACNRNKEKKPTDSGSAKSGGRPSTINATTAARIGQT